MASPWVAPSDWHTIDFISDLHLSEQSPKTSAAFRLYLSTTPAQAVVILGDLFEVWVGDDVAQDPWITGTMAALVGASQRLPCVALMVGNRDFLMQRDWLHAQGLHALEDPCTLVAFDRRWVLSHGDALCLDDTAYQAFRKMVRAPEWQAEFLRRPRAERMALAQRMREGSRAHQASPSVMHSADADPALTQAWLEAAQADGIIHGHTHRPALHQPAVAGAATSSQRWVLSDWDLDGPPEQTPRAEILRLTQRGLGRVDWTQSVAASAAKPCR